MKVELNLEKERTKLDMSDLLPFYAVCLFSGKKNHCSHMYAVDRNF